MKTPQEHIDAYRELRLKGLEGDAEIRELKVLLEEARKKNLPSWERFLEGCIAFGEGQYDEALRLHEKALEHDPGNASALFAKAFTLRKQDKLDQAIVVYDEFIARFGESTEPVLREQVVEALDNKSAALGYLGRHKDALAVCEESIRRNPNKHFSWGNKGNALGLLGQYEEALTAFDECLRLDPSNPKTWGNKGKIYFLLPDIDSACRCFRRFCKLAGSDGIFKESEILHRTLAQERWNPFLIHRLVLENPGLLALAGFRDAWAVVEKECETPLVLMELLDSGLCVLEERERLRVGGLLCYLHGDPIQAEEAWLGQLNDRYPDDLLGQYYLVSAIKDSFGDAGAALDEALSKAEALLGAGGNDPEQLYYAGMLFRLAERIDEALRCFDAAKAAALEQGYPAAGIMRAIVLNEAERDAERDEMVESILAAEHTRAGIGNQGWLAGFAVQEINFLEAGWDGKVVRLAQTLECEPIIFIVDDWLDAHPDVADPIFLERYRGYLFDTDYGMRGAWTLAEGAWDKRTMASSAAMVARLVKTPVGAYAGVKVGTFLDLGPADMSALAAGGGVAMEILGRGAEYLFNLAPGDTNMSYPEFRTGFNAYARRT